MSEIVKYRMSYDINSRSDIAGKKRVENLKTQHQKLHKKKHRGGKREKALDGQM